MKSKAIVYGEYATYNAMTPEQKKEYDLQSEIYVRATEDHLIEMFAKYDAKDVAEIIIEKIRDGAYINISNTDIKYRSVIFKLSYYTCEAIFNSLKTATDEQNLATAADIRRRQVANLLQADETNSKDELLSYVRAYSKYWSDREDETDKEDAKS